MNLIIRGLLTFQGLAFTLCNMNYRVEQKEILRSAHTVYLCVLCGSQNGQQLFPYTALTDRFL